MGVFTGGPVVKTSPPNEGVMVLIPGWGCKIPNAIWPNKSKHKTEVILQQIQ